MKYELAESILESTMQHWDMTRMSEETKNPDHIGNQI